MAKKKSRRASKKSDMKSNDLPGVSLEKAVARIQQMLDPNSEVVHDERLVDRVGNTRQYDVVIRGSFAGQPVLGVIECKDHKRKKGPAAIEAFAKKTENLGANLRMIVSSKGFTDQALKLAKHEHITCLSLLASTPTAAGLTIGCYWYGVIKRWTDVQFTVFYADEMPPAKGFTAGSAKHKGIPIVNWFIKELLTTHGDEEHNNYRELTFDFSEPKALEVGPEMRKIRSLTCTAKRVFRKKRKWISWTGDAIYDWNAKSLMIPAQGSIEGSPVEIDLLLWDDFDGKIPDLTKGELQGLVPAVIYDVQRWEDDKEVIDPNTI